jgi:hypothetical protein
MYFSNSDMAVIPRKRKRMIRSTDITEMDFSGFLPYFKKLVKRVTGAS